MNPPAPRTLTSKHIVPILGRVVLAADAEIPDSEDDNSETDTPLSIDWLTQGDSPSHPQHFDDSTAVTLGRRILAADAEIPDSEDDDSETDTSPHID